MASDCLESKTAVMNFNRSPATSVPPSRTQDQVPRRRTSSPSSSGVSGDEDLDEQDHRTAQPLEPCEEAQENQDHTGPGGEEEEAGRGRLHGSGPVGRSVSLGS